MPHAFSAVISSFLTLALSVCFTQTVQALVFDSAQQANVHDRVGQESHA